MPHPTPENLEKLLHQTLRSLPDRRAPRSLETRVLAAIAAQQALPWWRQSFTHWPLAARGAFLVVTALLAAAIIALCFRTTGELPAASWLAGPAALWARVSAVCGGVSSFFAVVVRSIPALWLYGGLAFIATMYAALFGLGAAAYRSFFVQR
ncbi:MAG: hypothetical protein KBF26_11955 [Opitutaceae bacterium]|jgi:hypothetical protein|nr:hypothetical protein [Opitutaceae bacterium]